jgi:hypothetical protein
VKWNGHWFIMDAEKTDILSVAFAEGEWTLHLLRPFFDIPSVLAMLREAEHFACPALNFWDITSDMTFEQNQAGWIMYLREVWKGEAPYELETVLYD